VCVARRELSVATSRALLAFLEHCAREIANLPELGDGVLHRMIVRVQRMYFDPISTAACRASVSGSGSGGDTCPEKALVSQCVL
jgi:hypothetical protein